MPKPPIPHPTLTTPRLRLRPFRADDTNAMHECYADPEAMRFWKRPPHATSRQTERAMRRVMTPAKRRAWAVADAQTDLCLGMVNYHNADLSHRSADIGYMIHPARHGQGIATEAVTALVDHCFGLLALHRLTAFIDPENTASIRLAENLGFRREGLLRETLFLNNAWRSDLVYGLLVTDRPAAPDSRRA